MKAKKYTLKTARKEIELLCLICDKFADALIAQGKHQDRILTILEKVFKHLNQKEQ